VAIILEELGVPYTITNVELADLKKEPYTTVNPNGRVPAIQDPNTGVTLWESGAIVQYLVEQYDPDHKLTYTTTPQKHHLNQWLMFQVSGQGPYYGQASWFSFFHHEKLPSARERYMREVERVIGVLDSWLKDDHEFLVGDKVTYADLSFVPWAAALGRLDPDKTIDVAKYPAYSAWLDKLLARDSVQKIMAAH
jgi:glutathione S-transferase